MTSLVEYHPWRNDKQWSLLVEDEVRYIADLSILQKALEEKGFSPLEARDALRKAYVWGEGSLAICQVGQAFHIWWGGLTEICQDEKEAHAFLKHAGVLVLDRREFIRAAKAAPGAWYAA